MRLSLLRRRSHSIPAPASSAAAKAITLFSGKAVPECSPRWAKPAGPGSSGSGPDGDDRIHFDRNAEWQHCYPDGAPRMAACLTEHVLHQLRSAIRDLGLVG